MISTQDHFRPASWWLSQSCDSYAAAFCCRDVGPNGPNNKHSLEEHLWHVGSTTSTTVPAFISSMFSICRQQGQSLVQRTPLVYPILLSVSTARFIGTITKQSFSKSQYPAGRRLLFKPSLPSDCFIARTTVFPLPGCFNSGHFLRECLLWPVVTMVWLS